MFIERSGNESEGDSFLLTASWVSYDPPLNKATDHPRWQNVSKRKINGVKRTWTLKLTLTMVHCGFHVPNVTKLKAVVNLLQRTYFKT